MHGKSNIKFQALDYILLANPTKFKFTRIQPSAVQATAVFLVPHRTNLTFSFILQYKITLPNTDQAQEKISIKHYE